MSQESARLSQESAQCRVRCGPVYPSGASGHQHTRTWSSRREGGVCRQHYLLMMCLCLGCLWETRSPEGHFTMQGRVGPGALRDSLSVSPGRRKREESQARHDLSVASSVHGGLVVELLVARGVDLMVVDRARRECTVSDRRIRRNARKIVLRRTRPSHPITHSGEICIASGWRRTQCGSYRDST